MPQLPSPNKIALLYGGNSPEREVSISSARAIATQLEALQLPYSSIDVLPGFVPKLLAYAPSIAFNIAHGSFGEDGALSASLDTLGIKYTGSDCAACVLAMDKHLSKLLWREAGLPTLPWRLLTSLDQAQALWQEWQQPLALKPRCGGSSYGVSKVERASQLAAAYQQARAYGEVLAEPWITGNEYTVSIVDGIALPVLAIVPKVGFYDYAAKYVRGDTTYRVPSGLSADAESELQALSLAAFDLVGARDWGRVDVIQTADGAFKLLELNTVPGMTTTSLVPKAAAAQGWDFGELIKRILYSAYQRYESSA